MSGNRTSRLALSCLGAWTLLAALERSGFAAPGRPKLPEDQFRDFSPQSDENGDVNGGGEPVTLRCEKPALENGDVNGDRRRDISDAVYLPGWKFAGGPAPKPGCDTDPGRDVHEDHEEDLDSIRFLNNSGLRQTLGVVPDVIRQLARPQPIYKLRIDAIRTANNDGSQAATITPADLQQLIDRNHHRTSNPLQRLG